MTRGREITNCSWHNDEEGAFLCWSANREKTTNEKKAFVAGFKYCRESNLLREKWYKSQLDKLAHFNPDWDILKATQESLNEHVQLLHKAKARIAKLEAAIDPDPPVEYEDWLTGLYDALQNEEKKHETPNQIL